MSIATRPEVAASPQPKRALITGALGLATLAMCIAVVARVPLWGRLAWGIHETPDFIGNLPFLGALALLFGAHALWMRAAANRVLPTVAALGALMLALLLCARLGENAGWGRLAILTVNPASGGFYEAAYDSRDDPNWLRDYPALMKQYHHVHSHPPAPVAAMRWLLKGSSPAMTAGADNLLAISPGVNSEAVAQLTSRIWKRPYVAADMAAAFWGGMLWLACALVVPGAVYVAARAVFGARAALHGGVLACAVPSFLMFVPAADASYLACAALALALAAVGSTRLESKAAPLTLALGGVVAAVGVTGSFAGAWTILLTTIFLAWRAPSRALALKGAAIFGGAAVLTLLLFQLLGVNWLLFGRSVIAFNVDADVPPVTRFLYHFADFFAFMGVPISVVLGWGVWRAWRKTDEAMVETTEPNRSWRRDVLVLTVPTLATLLTLNIVISMAETARIWMLFMPPLLVAVGGVLGREETHLPRWVLAVQLVQTWVFVVFLNVWSF